MHYHQRCRRYDQDENNKTKSFIIEREIPFKTGDTIATEKLIKYLEIAKQQLINTSLFLDVSVYIEKRYNQFVFITVYVKERWYILPLPYFKYIDPNINTWWVTYNHSLKRTNYGIKFLHNNISGRNDKRMPPSITETLYNAAASPKKDLLIVEGAETSIHGHAFQAESKAYIERVSQFLDAALANQ